MISTAGQLRLTATSRREEYTWKLNTHIKCATVHKLIRKNFGVEDSVAKITVVYKQVDLTSFMDQVASTSSFIKFFEIRKKRKIYSLQCNIDDYSVYNIFQHPDPKFSYYVFVIYDCLGPSNASKGIACFETE